MKPFALLIGLCVLSGCEATSTDQSKQIDKLRGGCIRLENALRTQAEYVIKLEDRVEALERGEHSLVVKPEKCDEPSPPPPGSADDPDWQGGVEIRDGKAYLVPAPAARRLNEHRTPRNPAPRRVGEIEKGERNFLEAWDRREKAELEHVGQLFGD